MTDSSEKRQVSSNELYYQFVRAAWACKDCDGQGHNFVPGACKVCKTCQSLRDALLEIRGPFMSLQSKPGDKIRYHWGLAGYDGDVKWAREHLTLGAIYTIKRLDVYDSTSIVSLEEAEGGFNPVQFAPVTAHETGRAEALEYLAEARRYIECDPIAEERGVIERFDTAVAALSRSPETRAVNCREAGPGKGLCIECANGHYERCLYVRGSEKASEVRTWICPNCKSENRDDYHRISCPGCGKLRPPSSSEEV